MFIHIHRNVNKYLITVSQRPIVVRCLLPPISGALPFREGGFLSILFTRP